MNQLFYTTRIDDGFAYLEDEESRHLQIVLRHKAGDSLQITDGMGHIYEAVIAETGKKHTVAQIISTTVVEPERPYRLHVAIAPTKNMERYEWFLEKATEIGIDEITPLLCNHSERNTVRMDRMEKILVSAMKQSLRAYLPKLNPLTKFSDFIGAVKYPCKLIGWCGEETKPHLYTQLAGQTDITMLVGPEGDFSVEEVKEAAKQGFQGVTMGAIRLRTETAGLLVVSAANMQSVYFNFKEGTNRH